jgi:GntR family transcriptional regulator, transcriptional repressor for pyruvate dehydrogenase complex
MPGAERKVAVRDARRSEKIAVPKMAELVAERVRGQIARGEFKPGDALPSETALMERFGVARPTMREAIRILESESLISTRRGSQSGPKVRAIDASVLGRRAGLLLQVNGTTWEDLYEAQMVIEPRAVRLAAKRRTKADVAALRALIERARRVVDLADFAPIAAEFHVALVRASKNKTLTLVVEMLHSLTLELYRNRLMSLRPIGEKVRSASVDLYEHVTERIEARDLEGAEEVWSKEHPAVSDALGRMASERGIAIYHP